MTLHVLPGTLREVLAEQARRSLASFVKQAWEVIEPGKPLIWNWHLDVMCNHVQALLEGNLGKQNLLINVPPGSMKSTIVSVCTTPWMWLRNPSWRGIYATGSDSLAIRDSIKCRCILDSDWYRQSFRPQWEFTKDQNAKGHYKNTKTGFRLATSSGSSVTGERGDALFIDDPLDAAYAFSKAERDRVLVWYDNAIANRLNDLRTGIRCLIMQRLHEEDLAGHVLDQARDEWDALVIREEYERPTSKDPDCISTSLGWRDPRTEEGELFFPERFPAHVIASEKVRLASAGYAGQHQQRPTAATGNIFKKGFVRFYKTGTEPRFTRKLLSADTAFKEKQESDYSVMLAAGECIEPGRAGVWLLDRWKDRAGYPDLKDKAKTMGARYKPKAFLIEDKASGQSLIQDLRRDTGLSVVPVIPEGDKVYRANLCVPHWESGNVWVPEDAEWVDDFLEQLYGFPRMAHDDDVDAFTQLVHFVMGGQNQPFNINPEFIKRLG